MRPGNQGKVCYKEGCFWYSMETQAVALHYTSLAVGNVIFLEKAHFKLYKTSHSWKKSDLRICFSGAYYYILIPQNWDS